MIRWLASRKIRVRLTLWYVLILALVLIVFIGGVYIGLRKVLSDSLNESVEQRSDALIGVVFVEDGQPTLPESVIQAARDEADEDDEITNQDDEPFARTWNTDGQVVSNAGATPSLPSTDAAIQTALNGGRGWLTIGEGTNSFRVLARPIHADGKIVGVLEVGQSGEDVHEALEAFVHDLGGDLAVHAGGRGAGARGGLEAEGLRVADCVDERQGLGELGLGFAGEADDEIAR